MHGDFWRTSQSIPFNTLLPNFNITRVWEYSQLTSQTSLKLQSSSKGTLSLIKGAKSPKMT